MVRQSQTRGRGESLWRTCHYLTDVMYLLLASPAVMFPLHGMNPETVLGIPPIEDTLEPMPNEVICGGVNLTWMQYLK